MKTINFPFSAILGQPEMRLALLLNVIDPQIGGVLLTGHQGTGKSTAVRSLVDILPEIEVVADCPFSCDPKAPDDELCDTCRERKANGPLPVKKRKMRVVNLPLGVTEDMVTGSLDIERVLKEGVRALQPGLLARANRGILYIDEINLLQDHIVDVLLDAAASGVNLIEREGVSVAHPSRFILVGSMNPEEGELRPQISDRLGLEVELVAPKNPRVRAEITRHVVEFQSDPKGFVERFAEQQAELARRVREARERVLDVEIPPAIYRMVSELVASLGVSSQRADITCVRCARAHAAFHGRTRVTMEDVEKGALALVLKHRMRAFDEEVLPEEIEAKIKDIFGKIKKSYVNEDLYSPNRDTEGPLQASDSPQPEFKRNPLNEENVDIPETREQKVPDRDDDFPQGKWSNPGGHKVRHLPGRERFDVRALTPARRTREPRVVGILEQIEQWKRKSSFSGKGRRTKITSYQKGRYVSYKKPKGLPRSIAFDATLKCFLQRQVHGDVQFPLSVEIGDLREKIFQFKAPLSMFFILDASASMAKAVHQMATVISSLQKEGYKRKDKISLIMFRGKRAHVLQRPTTNMSLVYRRIRNLRGENYTPMADALRKAVNMIKAERMRNKDTIPVIIICSDMGANISARHPDLVAQVEQDYVLIAEEIKDLAKNLGRLGIKTIILLPKKSYALRYVGVNPFSAEKIKEYMKQYARAKIYQFDSFNPTDAIVRLRRSL
ncbi:MAG: putative cobaltochelatase [Promethearchaeota archaeon]